MSHRALVVVVCTLAACGPSSKSAEPDAGAAGGHASPDSPLPPIADGPVRRPDGPVVDGQVATNVVIYAHSPTELFRIDPQTFELTVMGTFSVPDRMTDLAVTPDGTIYTISYTMGTSTLWQVEASSARCTRVVDITNSPNAVGMTFLPDNTLLVADKDGQVFRVDPRAGTATKIGEYGMMMSTAGDLVAVADGTMFGMSDKKPGGATAAMSNILLRVNSGTGVGTPIGTGIGYGKVFGLAFVRGKVYAFTDAGEIVEIDHMTGTGRLVRTHAGKQFWGAGVTPLVTIG